MAERATEARATALARGLAARLRTALVVWVGAEEGLLLCERTGVLMGAEGIVGDLSLVGQSPSDDGGALTLFWLGGPHVCACKPQPVTGKGGPAWLQEPGVLAGVHVR